jgi:hypothetical protein
MPPRRHLPVLSSAPAAPPPESVTEPPPWHWIPLGSVVSLLALIPLGPAVQRGMRAALEIAYPAGATAAQLATLRRVAPGRGLASEVLAVSVPVGAVLLCVALGGYIVGRRGERTNHRHGVLSGACTALLCGALSGSVVATLALVPLAMLVGGVSARVGVNRRERSTHHEP